MECVWACAFLRWKPMTLCCLFLLSGRVYDLVTLIFESYYAPLSRWAICHVHILWQFVFNRSCSWSYHVTITNKQKWDMVIFTIYRSPPCIFPIPSALPISFLCFAHHVNEAHTWGMNINRVWMALDLSCMEVIGILWQMTSHNSPHAATRARHVDVLWYVLAVIKQMLHMSNNSSIWCWMHFCQSIPFVETRWSKCS